MKTFLIDYEFDGTLYSFSILAKDWAEAEERLWAIQDNAEVEGELIKEIHYEQ